MTRPLGPYPQQAVYIGPGDTNSAADFVWRVVHDDDHDFDDRDR